MSKWMGESSVWKNLLMSLLLFLECSVASHTKSTMLGMLMPRDVSDQTEGSSSNYISCPICAPDDCGHVKAVEKWRGAAEKAHASLEDERAEQVETHHMFTTVEEEVGDIQKQLANAFAEMLDMVAFDSLSSAINDAVKLFSRAFNNWTCLTQYFVLFNFTKPSFPKATKLEFDCAKKGNPSITQKLDPFKKGYYGERKYFGDPFVGQIQSGSHRRNKMPRKRRRQRIRKLHKGNMYS
ncbi:hypothetical protein BJ742DRAFT_745524 [Cladochytrium replicatum]|nr:hypothetical protein BJ742DRAFT_745524 [Cladochytrium replicatum]